MIILVDTNVVIDFLITREPFYAASADIMKKCASGEITGYLAFHSLTNLWNILRKVPEEDRRRWLFDICGVLKVCGVSHEQVVKAIQMVQFKDFEDCLQDKCAEMAGADYLLF